MATPEETAQQAAAAKLAETEGAIAAEKERYTKALDEANKLLREQLDLEQSLEEIAKERKAIQESSRAIAKQRADAATDMAAAVAELAENEAILNEAAKQGLENRIALAKQLLEDTSDTRDALGDQVQVLKEQESTINKVLATQKKYGDDVNATLDAAKKSAESFSGIAKSMAGDIPVIGGQLQKLMSLQTKVPKLLNKVADAAGGMSGAIGGFLGPHIATAARSLATAITGIGIATVAAYAAVVLFVGKIMSMAIEVNNLSKEIGKATGFGDKFNEEITRMGTLGNMASIGFKESADALKALTTGLSSFNPNAEKTNMNVGMTVARLEKLGVSSAASVKSIDHMQRAMGLSAEKAADMTAQVARMGKEIGISGTKMIEDFNAASGRLAIYGNQNIKVFKQLAAQAKATGIAMQSLINISQKFDQFDTAADSAAKLNAVLGTQLSTIEMMNATDSERIMILKQEVQASVGNFDSLDKFTKQYVAQAMGVASVDEAQRLLNMSTAEYQKYQDGQKESADIQKELADASAEMVPIMQQLKLAIMQAFLAFAPLIEGIAKFLGFISPFIVMIGKAIGVLSEAAAVIGVVFLALKLLTGGIALFLTVSQIGLVIAAISGLVWALSKLWDIIHKPGSKSMAEGMFDKDIGASIGQLGADAAGAQNDISNLSAEMEGMHDAVHKGGGGAIDIQAMANLDTSAIAAGFDKIKSAVMELSSVKIDGFLAMKTDGSSSSFVMGSDGLIKSISEGKLTVDVKIPDMKMPDISVKVYIGDRELRDIIRTEAKAVVGRAG